MKRIAAIWKKLAASFKSSDVAERMPGQELLHHYHYSHNPGAGSAAPERDSEHTTGQFRTAATAQGTRENCGTVLERQNSIFFSGL